MSSVSSAAESLAAESGSPGAHAAGWPAVAGIRARAAYPREGLTDLFARCIGEYVRQHPGEPVRLLQAGCTAPADDLDLGKHPDKHPDKLGASRVDLSIRSIDQDHPAVREAASRPAAGGGPGLRAPAVLGDLRTIPIPSRTFDIVHCAHLLDRIQHAELVLDRLVAALKPGGLLLLRIRDRQSAAGLLDRILPRIARRAIWHWLRPEQAGPFPAVFEPLVSAAGIQGYVLARGLVIAERQAVRDRPLRPARLAWGAPAACRIMARLSRGRLADDHDDLVYVIRRPESGFARVL
ncbi:MAG TPA: class I SAM-dependent methyltransferase [Streptosporangiaceae bacterium]|jgi:SAM-dependent methyltransferase